ncbi:glycoside hydrolase family 6 protein [Nocardia seriolae]|uniref:glycoside hydrolase family 6 protein n=1 Tax=Nocardia seriolae TaxID=37332 RepID=UPI0004BB0E91|nr:glycoside hydrolase family 6 protein [Nocardia seriolae]QOW36157.1 glycoside hydrolase family 6 protein [Nocardia seriolae]QUN16339.1 glycoside hydrolase family 6 protein [Nocardia seriolae]WKY55177.1 glycoside hydrolase family 6 protein [Nocardia seriolae]WNJ56605.1 glycoside hydrolase family 6 protein [Nocardia seriolae]BAW07900.1 glycoside hydrolase family 6 [Nocardia seriolae]
MWRGRSGWARSRAVRAGALGAVFVLAACGRSPVGSESPVPVALPRNAPASGEYLLESNDGYYADLRATLPTVTDPRTEANLERLLRTPVAEWLPHDSAVTAATIRQDLARASAAGSIPMFVAYNIPGRDLHGESGGGQAGADAYQASATPSARIRPSSSSSRTRWPTPPR